MQMAYCKITGAVLEKGGTFLALIRDGGTPTGSLPQDPLLTPALWSFNATSCFSLSQGKLLF